MIRAATRRTVAPAPPPLHERGSHPAPRHHQISDADLCAAHAKAEREAAWWASRYSLDEESAGMAAIAALAEATQSFRAEAGANFATFSTLCIRRRLSDLARRQDPNREALDIDGPVGDQDGDPVRDLVPDEAPGPEQILLHAEEREAMAGLRAEVRAAVRLLPPFEQKVILRRYWMGETQKRVSFILQVSQARVFKAEHAALAQLKDVLAPAMAERCD